MGHYAKIVDGLVVKVIVAEPEYFDTFVDDSPGQWIQTSYNTYGGVHSLGGTPLRKNFAGVGFSYDTSLDAFVPPKPYPSWTLNETTGLWDPPTPKPEGVYNWNESTQQWEVPV